MYPQKIEQIFFLMENLNFTSTRPFFEIKTLFISS